MPGSGKENEVQQGQDQSDVRGAGGQKRQRENGGRREDPLRGLTCWE